MRSRGERGDHGQTSLLIIGFAVVGLLVIVVVVDASAAYLRRQALDSLADGAALAAADGVQSEQIYLGGLGERAQLDPAVAHSYAAEYLAASGAAGRYPGLRFSVQTSAEVVVVRVTAPLEMPFSPPGWAADATVTGTAASYVAVGD
ncbi:MAG: hypothetical protein AVDCRST_MAG72-654 [uncultured Nocardioidaceae bacterium]|uniref:Putative Flp pilus-assembly TadG-like N-terminal domain-containing protein n=1 Tax=uncultured Nocardioidaceae bacterium TaxID=253824 RepID=A0A6J4LQN6_9ACTN|nr:MAG: hypothetical protein AVDCRST_MAG72-654 [uncultured Nocardioidaceae bacterium]